MLGRRFEIERGNLKKLIANKIDLTLLPALFPVNLPLAYLYIISVSWGYRSVDCLINYKISSLSKYPVIEPLSTKKFRITITAILIFLVFFILERFVSTYLRMKFSRQKTVSTSNSSETSFGVRCMILLSQKMPSSKNLLPISFRILQSE